ncbi:MAG: hypothetical protein UZ21_OP11001000224 [Microgenomates bacterium OLB22]|nr:MAG: hypothetical protein UZ21_OP11001000224 [Microgenomates bacterium OLB22]
MNILVISHSFFMKLLEVYIRTDKMLYNRPQLLADHVDPLKKLYDFNTGFDFTLEGDSLSLK